jgi:chromosome segregation protein
LTRLDLQGFKSFAAKTVFTFEPGITAVIGPNGSGKSNISDAVRWVLGEQSHGALRSKKTEDVIFAGGRGRAQAGMAEVGVTFDNSTGWLPIDFSEVTVTRRAYRSGENQYLINNRRVRLKDITQLTASLGQSHTVVGQGLVDTALSQRAEERRALFEHAADLTGFRLKAAEAERSLNEAEANSARLRDLLSELEPRLKTLARAAKQANEWRGLRDRLRELQRSHYGLLLARALRALTEAEAAAANDGAALATRQAEVERLATDLEAARTAADEAREALERQNVRLQAAVDESRRIDHERDLAAERHQALSRRREDMADTQAGLDEQVIAVQSEQATLASEIQNLESDVSRARQTVAELQQRSAATRQERTTLEARARKLATTITDAERGLADLARRQALREQRRDTDAADRARMTDAIAERKERIERLFGEIAAFQQADAKDTTDLRALDERVAALKRDMEQATARANDAREQVAGFDRRIDQARTRLDVLQRLQDSGAGLFAGVRAVLQAARDQKLRGVRGTVAELIIVPARFDTAIEVVLGGHLQDLVVEHWADAEAAISFLKREKAGRATFQPLDTVKGTQHRGLSPDVERMPGVCGRAADLIDAPADVRPVVMALLGRTLVVEDLPTTRAVLVRLPNGWSVVTLGGEIARTGGSVTGGAAVRETGVLGRERELRELPVGIERFESERRSALDRQTNAAEEPRRLASALQAIDGQRAALTAARKERQGQQARLAGWLRDVQKEQAAAESRITALTTAVDDSADELTRLIRETAKAESMLKDARAEQDALAAELVQDADTAAVAERTLSNEQRALAGLEERLRAERRRASALIAQQRALTDELAHRAQRTAALDVEREELRAQHQRLVRNSADLMALRDMVERERQPVEIAARDATKVIGGVERALESARIALMEAERTQGVRGLDVERVRGALVTIRQRIEDDLELADADDSLLDGADERPEEIDPGAEQEITRLKERLRRVGYVGEDVVGEYEREAERHAFLRSQLDDVEGAATSIRTLLDDLRSKMQARFDETFAQVAAAFTEAFTVLFGGGTARLVMTASENGDGGGIDIVAQPPGKRLQSLALLSGGERALTAVALLFAILKVNPTPFCLLDEVDAALDEANVVRFREQLQVLAAETQAIVITHNRGTIEIADTLYGISMGDDGVSQVLSLRLEEAVTSGTA